MVPPRSDRISRVPPYSRTCALSTRTGLSPTSARLSRRFRFLRSRHWPGPRSLATTSGVSVDVLSSGYLDVSVRRVCLAWLWIHHAMTQMGRVSPFGNPRIKACSQLPAAYRSVLRPSSPLSAKASTKCPYCACSNSITRRGKPRREHPTARTSPRRHTQDATRIRPAGRTRCVPWSKPIHDDKRARPPGTGPGPSLQPRAAHPSAHLPGLGYFVSILRVSGARRPAVGCFRVTRRSSGGADRDRTGDLLLAKQALSQLSYSPGLRCQMPDYRCRSILTSDI